MGEALRFERDLDAALTRIASDPDSLPVCLEASDPTVRYQRLTAFPYRVLFRATDPAAPVALALLPLTAGPAAYRRAERRR